MLSPQTLNPKPVERESDWVCEGIRRESNGMHVQEPTAEFIAGEGDDKAKGYKWQYIEKFQTSDKQGKKSREVLGHVVGLLCTAAGMCIEPQDRTGRVTHDKLIDTSGRIEFVSRIFVKVDARTMYSLPKLRKTFFAACVTFNVADSLHEACAVKMLSLISVAEQCPLQSQFFEMPFRFHQHRATTDHLHVQRRKYEWWEYKLVLYAKDNKLAESRSTVYEHFMQKISDWGHSQATDAMKKALAFETQQDERDIQALIDLLKGIDGKDQEEVASAVPRYVAVLPPLPAAAGPRGATARSDLRW